jgi:hypothetical protein
VTLCILLSAAPVWPFGAEEAPLPQNPEWVLTITAADTSLLPVYQRGVGELVARSLVRALESVSTRVRNTEEYAWYEDYARSKARYDAADKVAKKRIERDNLVFQGLPEWKYDKSLKAKDAEIAELEKQLALVTADIPRIEERPVFKLSEENKKGTFPAAPDAGGAYRFCATQKADAFLRLSVSDFQGRFHLNIALYTQAGNGFQYEDDVIFSSEDLNSALNEAAFRLVTAVSGAPPAAVAIHITPDDALVLLNGSFAGNGEVKPREHPPGKLSVEAYADEYTPLATTLELNSGELTDFAFNLRPEPLVSFTLDTPQGSAALYRGALYIGQTPFTLGLPLNERQEYIHAEGEQGEATVVLSPGAGTSLDFKLIPRSTEEKRVAKSRRSFYSAFGRFWIALPIAFVFGAMASTEKSANNSSTTQNDSLYANAVRDRYISIGLWTVFGLTAVQSVYRIFKYVRTSGEDSPILTD